MSDTIFTEIWRFQVHFWLIFLFAWLTLWQVQGSSNSYPRCKKLIPICKNLDIWIDKTLILSCLNMALLASEGSRQESDLDTILENFWPLLELLAAFKPSPSCSVSDFLQVAWPPNLGSRKYFLDLLLWFTAKTSNRECWQPYPAIRETLWDIG